MNLERFLNAQNPVYARVLAELRNGRKESHWMWFVFPQLRGLGFSSTAQYCGISGLGEATAYLDHPVLGARLRECCELVCAFDGEVEEIFPDPDHLKLRSSMTLFGHAAHDSDPFTRVLNRFFGGAADSRTIDLLSGPAGL